MIHPKKSLEKITPYKAGISKTHASQIPIKLSSNENPYGASPKAVQAYHDSALKLSRYPDGNVTKLKDALSSHYNIDKNHIVCGAGSDNIIEILSLCFIEEGSEAIFTQNTFPIYDISVKTAGGIPVTVPYKKDLTIDIDGIIQACTSKTKIIFIASPDNPTGTYVPFHEIERLIQSISSNILIVIDEAYYEFATAKDYKTSLGLVKKYPNIAVTRTFSKIFGLAALRVGWGYLPEIAVDVFHRIRSPFNVSLPAQNSAISSLEDIHWQKENIEKNLEEKEKLHTFLCQKRCNIIPSEGNFILIHSPNAFNIYHNLYDNGIIIRHMASNKMEDYIRISVGTKEEMEIFYAVTEKLSLLD